MKTRQEKVINLFKLKKAIDKREEAFILFNKLEELADKIEGIKPADLSSLQSSIAELKEKKEEPIEIELEII